MRILNINETSVISGGGLLEELWTIIEVTKAAVEVVVGAVQGAQNLAEFAGKDPVLEAVRGGNLGS